MRCPDRPSWELVSFMLQPFKFESLARSIAMMVSTDIPLFVRDGDCSLNGMDAAGGRCPPNVLVLRRGINLTSAPIVAVELLKILDLGRRMSWEFSRK